MRTIYAALLSLFASLPAFASTYSGLYFFGDSLTDTGNVTAVYATVPKLPGEPAVKPGVPYFDGRASNGPLYSDVLASGLGLQALASAQGGNNFAFGGARTRYQLVGPPFLGIGAQVAQFNARPGPADPNALYVLWGGSNNLQDILLGRTSDVFGKPIPGVGATLGDIGGMLNSLYAEGARNLLVPNVPNLGRVPRIGELGGAPARAAGTFLSKSFNDGLNSLLNGFDAAHPDANLIRFDTFGALEGIAANAAGLGLLNLTDRCYTGDDRNFTGGGTVCANPDSYLFWDGIHPTAFVHKLLGQAMLGAVAAVPEPSTYATMALGLLLLGCRRRLTAKWQPASGAITIANG